ncbi:MAG: protein-glutamate O-methyltransferase CheR [Deltaproteobacteria bacterium]|nr:protein-glutamate O-methyltransferase CheR [Deltaproteobacteria bacterium]
MNAPYISPVSEASEKIRRFVYDKSGIQLGADKDYLLESRLLPIMLEKELSDLDGLVKMVFAAPDELGQRVIEAMATNETYWFRDPAMWQAIQDVLLPQWREKHKKGEVVDVWSAACSLGQEPFSLGIVLLEEAADLVGKIRICASDVSEQNLAHAQEAKYHDIYMSRGLQLRHRRWFQECTPGMLELNKRVLNQVFFFQHNLLYLRRQDKLNDLVLLRNVLMYFDEKIEQKVVSLVSKTLAKDGVLVIGATERLKNPQQYGLRLETHGRVHWYRKS